MVGVAGKSKACHNCRQRRARCDLNFPHCRRCERAGLVCRGYARSPALFIDRTLSHPFATAQDVIAANRDHQFRSNGQHVDVSAEYRALLHTLTLPTYLPSEFRARAFRISCELYMPQESFRGTPIGKGEMTWLKSTCEIEYQSPTLDISLLAFCAAQLYAVGSRTVSWSDALQVYNEALERLRIVLQDIESYSLICTLASIIVQSTSELFICPSNAGWRAHVGGIAEILRIYQASSPVTKDRKAWSQLCARARMVTVLTELMKYRSGSLIPRDWREIMSGLNEEDALSGIVDIVHDLPPTWEMTDAPHAQSLLTMAAVHQRMRMWKSHLQRRVDQPLFHDVPSRMRNPADEGYESKLHETAVEFQSFPVARCLLIYWNATVQSLDLIIRRNRDDMDFASSFKLHNKIWNFLKPNDRDGEDVLDAIASESETCAKLICQSVEYMHSIGIGLVGPQSLGYAKWVLNSHYTRLYTPRELTWCQNIPNMTGRDSTCRIRTMAFES